MKAMQKTTILDDIDDLSRSLQTGRKLFTVLCIVLGLSLMLNIFLLILLFAHQ